MFSNIQIFLLSIPILFTVQDSPSAGVLVRCGVIFFNDFGVLLFIFAPKLLTKHMPQWIEKEEERRRTYSLTTNKSTRAKSVSSLVGTGSPASTRTSAALKLVPAAREVTPEAQTETTTTNTEKPAKQTE